MASLVVTFCKGYAPGEISAAKPNYPVAVGDTARTELIAIGVASVQGALVATADEDFVTLRAGAECYVKIGDNPTAVDGEGWHLAADGHLDLYISAGQKVAVIAATTIN